jgi:hypothetical protein
MHSIISNDKEQPFLNHHAFLLNTRFFFGVDYQQMLLICSGNKLSSTPCVSRLFIALPSAPFGPPPELDKMRGRLDSSTQGSASEIEALSKQVCATSAVLCFD